MKINLDALNLDASLNPELQRVHRILAIAWGAGWAVLIIFSLYIAATSLNNSSADLFGVFWFIFWLNFFVSLGFFSHWYAAKGAKLGLEYARVISRFIAFVWFFGFIVGTIFSFYIFSLTGDGKWKPSNLKQL